jgi:hypothetical protein
VALSLPISPAAAQGGLRPGEAYVTRFSGTTQGPDGSAAINPAGTVGSIIDVRAPGQPPGGWHWINEPQRQPVTAGEVGQVFGVALDDASPPGVYLTATAAFGLHRGADNRDWMPGMWGPGGPGAIYKLDASTGFRPRLFATVTLNGRQNSGAALGNLAYDKINKQLFVSDLETGMIHRIGMDGGDRGFFDHGTQGRTSFRDAMTQQQGSLPPIAFNPASQARIADCPQRFDTTPECWNVAASGRRVWGLGVRGEGPGQVRLYYAVWSGPDFGNTAWVSAPDEEKRNTVWSIGIGPDGSFAVGDVRREFILPDFFVSPDDIGRAGYSRPVSDISFPTCTNRPVMLVAERGGMRNLGLAEEEPFATPHESRALRYELDQTGAWRPIGRYDIGFYDRQQDGAPLMQANCAGGIAFGFGYTPAGQIDLRQVDQFVWSSGDALCSPEAPCNLPPGAAQAAQPAPQGRRGAAQPVAAQASPEGDDSQVHGIQGMREDAIAELAPEAAFGANPQGSQGTGQAPGQATPTQGAGPNQAYLIDTDINVDAQGNPIGDELLRNDATLIGDIAIYQVCQQAPPAQPFTLLPPPPAAAGGVLIAGHFRFGSHFREISHRRWGSHAPYWSHNWVLSGWHTRLRSHWPLLSHQRFRSVPHIRTLSPHNRNLSPGHRLPLSPHNRILSPGHRRPLSPLHNRVLSPGHRQPLSPYHNRFLSPQNLHRRPLSPGVHRLPLSPGVHRLPLSPSTLHNRRLSPGLQHRAPLSPATLHNSTLSRSQQVIKRGEPKIKRATIKPRLMRTTPRIQRVPTIKRAPVIRRQVTIQRTRVMRPMPTFRRRR